MQVEENAGPDEGAIATGVSSPEPEGIVPVVPKRSRAERREQAVVDALRTLMRDLYLEKFGKAPAREKQIPLALHMTLRASEEWQLDVSPSMRDQIGAALEDAEAECNLYTPGHVYDFYTEQAGSAASVPPSALSVFKGFNSMGVPQWQDLSQMFLDAGDERISDLYAKPPRVLAALQYGKELTTEQLSTFGKSSKTYAVLAQVVAGYFMLPADAQHPQQERRLALTFQVVESRDPARHVKLHLNVLSYLPWERLQELFADGWEPGIGRACQLVRHELMNLEKKVNHLRHEGRLIDASRALKRIPAVMRQLVVSLERTDRQARRRTQHSEERRKERPTHKALEDARCATPQQLFFDIKSDAWIACGDHGRAHVFSLDGKHVTSFILKPDSIAFRVRTNRWRDMTPEEISTFQQHLAQSL
ncbi:MAG: hypothetical protein EOM20_00530 [Spartobacteria bacterium]|nr:hypothetical protein [Spartobacteria bacterium]